MWSMAPSKTKIIFFLLRKKKTPIINGVDYEEDGFWERWIKLMNQNFLIFFCMNMPILC